MKKAIFLFAVTVLSSLLMAAEDVNFIWALSGVNKGESFWRKNQPLKTGEVLNFSANPAEKWGPYLRIVIPEVEAGKLYMLRVDFQSEKLTDYHFKHDSDKQWAFNFTAGKGVQTIYLKTADAKVNGWAFSFSKRCGKVSIKEFSIKKITDAELTENLLPNEALEPGAWQSFWGNNGDVCKPELKTDDKSPEGKCLAFRAGKKGDGYIAGMPLPFLPNRKFELSFWVRGDAAAAHHVQILGTNLRTNFGIRKEWNEVKMSGNTGDTPGKFGFRFMFFDFKNPLSAFELGGMDFHYLPEK